MTLWSARRSALSGIVSMSVAMACTGNEGSDDVSRSTSPAVPDVRLTSTGGDVFAWTQPIQGEGACHSVAALVDGVDVDVPVRTGDQGFAFTVPVRSGDQEVAARCTLSDGDEVETESIVLTGMLDEHPTARIAVRVEGGAVMLDGSGSEPSEPDDQPLERFTWTPHVAVGQGDHHARLRLADGSPFAHPIRRDRLVLSAPRADGEYFVSLTVADGQGRTDRSTTYFVVEEGRPRAVDMMSEHPSWIDRALVYAPVHKLWGGGARNVERHLPYLKRLGVDALWLWPPVTRRALGEEYAIADYFSIDEEWGTPEEFRSMVDRAHELGLRVLLDFVPNHTSIDHRYFRTAEKEGPTSHYWDFYDRKPNGEPTHYFDWDHLPNLNYDDPQVRRMMTEAFSYWIRRYDVDGFRVDAAWGIKRRRPSYWKEWRAELKRIKPDLLLLAEATARDPYYFRNGFDVGYDWTDHPGQWPWASLWEFPQEIQSLIEPALSRRYPPDALVLRFLNNNDTEVRFAQQHGVKLTRVASALEFTVPGIPLLFAGDEIGARYQPYGPLEQIPWKDRYGLRPWYEGLIGLRDRLPALLSTEIEVLSSDPGSVVAYVRPAVPGGDAVLVVLNFGKSARPTFASSAVLDQVLGLGELQDALTGERFRFEQGRPVTLETPAYSVLILTAAGTS
jgi:cyclomaltodextrinase